MALMTDQTKEELRFAIWRHTNEAEAALRAVDERAIQANRASAHATLALLYQTQLNSSMGKR